MGDTGERRELQGRARLIIFSAIAGGLGGLFWRELFHHLAAFWR
jgi:hypothetical protein